MEDSFKIQSRLLGTNPSSAIVVGAGYIGVEMADALIHRGLRVTLVGKAKSVLPIVDHELGEVLSDELRRHGVEVRTEVGIDGIFASNCLTLTGSN